MAILSEGVREQLRARFAERLRGPVELTLYTRPGSGRLILPSGVGCATCDEARELAEELRDAAPDKVSLEIVDVSATPDADVTEALYTPEVSILAASLSREPAVRAYADTLQRAHAARGPVVVEGRDAGTVVFPDAECKFYLDASLEARARRFEGFYQQLLAG